MGFMDTFCELVSLSVYQAGRFERSDLGPNRLQKLSAEDTICLSK